MEKALLVCLLGLVISLDGFANQKAIVSPNTSAYLESSETSQRLGLYRSRTTVTLSDQAEDGWYRVIFPKEVHGKSEGWISASQIERFLGEVPQKAEKALEKTIEKPQKKKSHRSEKKSELFSNYLGALLDFHFASPSEFQTKIGAKKESVMFLNYGLEYGHSFLETLAAWVQFSRYGFSKYSDFYFASGYLLAIGGDYSFYRAQGWNIAAGLGLGVGLSEAGNTNGLIEKRTTSIVEPFYLARAMVGKQLGSSPFSIRGQFGYRLMNIPSLPSATPLSYANATSDFSLSSFFAGISFLYLF